MQDDIIGLLVEAVEHERIFKVNVRRDCTVSGLKGKISEMEGFEVERQFIIFNGDVLDDIKPIHYFGLITGSRVFLVLLKDGKREHESKEVMKSEKEEERGVVEKIEKSKDEMKDWVDFFRNSGGKFVPKERRNVVVIHELPNDAKDVDILIFLKDILGVDVVQTSIITQPISLYHSPREFLCFIEFVNNKHTSSMIGACGKFSIREVKGIVISSFNPKLKHGFTKGQ